MIASALYWAVAAALFVIAWALLALILAPVYLLACRIGDRRVREVEEMRELLSLIGRERREAHLAEMLANADALAREVQDARALRRILRDVRRAPVLAEADIDRIGEAS